jgi:hypothetical protein
MAVLRDTCPACGAYHLVVDTNRPGASFCEPELRARILRVVGRNRLVEEAIDARVERDRRERGHGGGYRDAAPPPPTSPPFRPARPPSSDVVPLLAAILVFAGLFFYWVLAPGWS